MRRVYVSVGNLIAFLLLCFRLVVVLANSYNVEPYQTFAGTYHPVNSSTWEKYRFGSTVIVNRESEQGGAGSLEHDIGWHCNNASVNQIYGMLLGHSEGGVFNNTKDSDIFHPLNPAGILQGAARFSNISKLCPQVRGVFIDDFFNNYIGKRPSKCVSCPASNPNLYGSKSAGYFCCPWPLSNGHHCIPPSFLDTAKPNISNCCLTAGTVKGCQDIPNCETNPGNLLPCKIVNDWGITLSKLKDIKGALLGKSIDKNWNVNHDSVATTPYNKLGVVWYTGGEIDVFHDNELLGIIDEISLWDFTQDLTYKNYTNSYALLRKKVGDDIPIIFGNYIKDSLEGWMSVESFDSIFAQSVDAYDRGMIDGMYIFSGVHIQYENATRYNIPAKFNKLLFPYYGKCIVTVLDHDGQPAKNIIVEVHFLRKARKSFITAKKTNLDGKMFFDGLAKGENNAYSVQLRRVAAEQATVFLVAQKTVHTSINLFPPSGK